MKIKNSEKSDEGSYECQINTHPIMALKFNLYILGKGKTNLPWWSFEKNGIKIIKKILIKHNPLVDSHEQKWLKLKFIDEIKICYVH